jgi:DNA-binding transcriptional LysR family regulator
VNLDQLRTFLAILEHGSFSRAAAALGVTQSTVSFHVKGLETSLGARLLDRLGGRVRPTERGRLLLRYAQRILALEEEALARLGAASAAQAGEVRVAASTIPAEYLLPKVVARFREGHPGVAVHVAVSDSKRALGALLADECDLALVGANPEDRRVVATRVAEDRIVLVGPARGPLARRRLSPEELARTPLVFREAGSGTGDAAIEVLARHGVTRPLVAIEIGSSEGVKRCVRSGLGLAFVSLEAVREELGRGELMKVALAGTPIRRSFFALRRASASLEPAAQALFALLGDGV